MKKRKPPYLLLSILVVFIAVAVIFNPITSKGMAQQEPAPEEMPAAGESRETETSDALAAKAAGAFSSTPSPAGPQRPSGPPAGAGLEERMPAYKNNPSVVVPDSSLNKPVPNDSGISSHWYRDNHVKQKQGK